MMQKLAMMTLNELKAKAANAALSYVDDNMIVGVGTGSTVNYFIEALAAVKHRIDACVSSSKQTEHRLRELGISVIDLNVANEVAVYIDGADEVNPSRQMIKGGGGALTREKIIACSAKKFVCIADETKLVQDLGEFPLAVEVLPMARSYVARELVKLGGNPAYRENFITDNGNIILDVSDLDYSHPEELEKTIKCITGVVENGIFANCRADVVLLATQDGVRSF